MADFLSFKRNFISAALSVGFNPLEFNIGYNFIESYEENSDERFYVFFRQDGSVFYLLNIYNDLAPYHGEGFAPVNRALRHYANKLIEKYNFRHIIIYNIIITNSISEEFSSLVDNGEEYFDQELYEINYVVLPDENRVGYSKKQPHQINDIMGLIKQSIAINEENADVPVASDPILRSEKQNAPKKRNFYSVYFIMIINLTVLLFMEHYGGSTNTQTLLNFGAMNFGLFISGDYYRVFTATFVHIGFMHFIYNSMSLYIFGTRVEKYFGTFMFLVIYFSSAIVGNLANSFMSDSVLAGASGGIYGLLGASLAFTQISKKMINGLSFYLILIFGLTGFLLGLSDPEIGNIAHFGGFVTGYLMGLIVTGFEKRAGGIKG